MKILEQKRIKESKLESVYVNRMIERLRHTIKKGLEGRTSKNNPQKKA